MNLCQERKGEGKREWDDQYVISYEINFKNLIIFAFILYVTKHCYKLIGIVHAPIVCACIEKSMWNILIRVFYCSNVDLG